MPTAVDDDRATTADIARHRRHAAEHERRIDAAYRAGQTGGPLGDDAGDDERQAWQWGQSDGPEPAPAGPAKPDAGRPSPKQRSRRGGGDSSGPRRWAPSSLAAPPQLGDLAGAAMSFVAYLAAVNYLRGGPAQLKAWFLAKWANKVKAG